MRFVALAILVVEALACQPEGPAPLGACSLVDFSALDVSGVGCFDEGADVDVTVDTSDPARASLSFPAPGFGRDDTVTVSFATAADAPLDALGVGVHVTQTFCSVTGEGSELRFVRIDDDASLFFAGGREEKLDGDDEATRTGTFASGDEQGDHCSEDLFGAPAEVVRRDVRVRFDAGDVVVDAGGKDGTIDNASVRAVGLYADTTTFALPQNVADGPSAGPHETSTVVGYAYRKAPSP